MNHFFPIEERTPEDNLCEPKKNWRTKKMDRTDNIFLLFMEFKDEKCQ